MSVSNMYGAASGSSSSSSSTTDRFQELDSQAFLKLMIAELQSQDPLNPMDNAQMLEQISQIRAITSNDELSKSIESLQIGQSMSTASGLLGKTITGQDVLGEEVTGVVDKVVFEDGTPYLYVGQTIVEIGNVYGMANSGTNLSTGTSDDATE